MKRNTIVKNFSKNDDGVSAVIGVILMVAITVIIAAVVGAYVFGMGSSVKKNYVIAFTIDRGQDGNIYITNNGGPDINKLDTSGSAVTVYFDKPVTMYSGSTTDLENVGGSLVMAAPDPNVHVIVKAAFKDGTQQVVSTATV